MAIRGAAARPRRGPPCRRPWDPRQPLTSIRRRPPPNPGYWRGGRTRPRSRCAIALSRRSLLDRGASSEVELKRYVRAAKRGIETGVGRVALEVVLEPALRRQASLLVACDADAPAAGPAAGLFSRDRGVSGADACPRAGDDDVTANVTMVSSNPACFTRSHPSRGGDGSE